MHTCSHHTCTRTHTFTYIASTHTFTYMANTHTHMTCIHTHTHAHTLYTHMYAHLHTHVYISWCAPIGTNLCCVAQELIQHFTNDTLKTMFSSIDVIALYCIMSCWYSHIIDHWIRQYPVLMDGKAIAVHCNIVSVCVCACACIYLRLVRTLAW